jgi:hypothetical protein
MPSGVGATYRIQQYRHQPQAAAASMTLKAELLGAGSFKEH